MTTYHVTDAGPRRCTATVKACPLAKDNPTVEHYGSKDEAQAAFERRMGGETLKAHRRERKFSHPLLKEWKGPFPSSTPGGKNIQEVFKANFKTLLEWEKSHGEELTPARYEQLTNPRYLLPQPEDVDFIRPRSISLLSKDELTTEQQELLPKGVTHVVEQSTRQGGGNRSCYCDDPEENGHESGCLAFDNEIAQEHPAYLFDEDSAFDNTYAFFYYAVPPTANVEEWQKDASAAKAAHAGLQLRKRLSSKGGTPWGVITHEGRAAQDAYQYALRRDKSWLQRKEQELTSVQERKAVLQDLVTRCTDGTLTYSKEDEIPLGIFQRGVVQRAADASQAWHTVKKNYENFTQAYREAEELPEASPLKRHLLQDRGSSTYKVQKGRGRNTRTVDHTIHYGSLLGEEKKKIEQDFSLKKKRYQTALEDLKRVVTEESSRLTIEEGYLQQEVTSVATCRERAWRTGWPKAEPQPPVPEWF